jgi:UDP:flavonoid glycosyltransferase YjiC (YdhE family)
MNHKKRILFIGEAVAFTHVLRPLVLAQSLNPEQYDIHFACDERYQSLISALPHIHYWPIRSIPVETFVKAADRGGYVLQKTDIESYVNQELALFGKVFPSLVIGDLRQTLSISAELSHIPYATLTNVYWSPYRIMEFNPIARFPMRSIIRKRIMAKLIPWREQSATASFNKVRKRYGLALLKDYCDLATRGGYTLYAEPAGFMKTMPLPDHHIFLGPILWEPDISTPLWWKTWNPELPLIYLTLGSTGAVKRLPEIVQVLQKFPVTIVVATAGRVQLKNMPHNVYATDYLTGMEICRLASVVVCNGGSTTAYQALSQGKPIAGIWSNIDQYLSMMTIESGGAGLCCSASSLDPKKLNNMILSLLNESRYRVRAGELAEKFRAYDACERFREFVQQAGIC